MLRVAASVLGFLMVVTIAPSARPPWWRAARSTNFQHQQPSLNSKLHAEKLVPIKKSGKLAPMAIKGTSVAVPIDRKVELSPASKESQRIRMACQQQLNNRDRFGSNERGVGLFDNSTTANNTNSSNDFSNFNSSANRSECGFSIPF